MSTHSTVRGLAALLGIGGLVPFVVLSGLCLGDPSSRVEYQRSLLVYATTIASFVGAVHWGIALRTATVTRLHAVQLAWSVVPSLASWVVAVSSEVPTALVRMAIVLGFCWLMDAVFVRRAAIPAWYFRLRSVLTVVAAASLAFSGIASAR
ncbi:DUF3429 domain-containing protein [Ralstonia pickettii]|uniref:DUF3429 domain-containing protein n=1 Tax=Ralstonia pickettii TaxID=329 RepID=A0A2N4TLS4_RALPI|nr:DUF3429 domain-containing protein [Ralstonia pickettii]PLC40629.1 DUF3429 domain-containing protein [Ralstonia pickettii]